MLTQIVLLNSCRKSTTAIVFTVLMLFMFVSNSLASGNRTVEGTIVIYDKKGNIKSDKSGVIVFLDELKSEYVPREEKAVVRQINKTFLPQTMPVMVGTTVEFPNDDTIFHNVFSLSKTKPFDLGLYRQGGSRSVKFDKPGLVKVYCNIHPQMIAYILITLNPYFTTTDKDGHFEITDVPEGRANLRTWYPRARIHPEKNIIVTKNGIHDLELSLIENLSIQIKEEKVSFEHKNKWGQNYPLKY